MQSRTVAGRWIELARLRLFRWEQISRIPTAEFNAVLLDCLREGWRARNEYRNFDAWIDYARIDLKSGRVRLRFEWTSWHEGEISGPRRTLLTLAQRYGLSPPTWGYGRYSATETAHLLPREPPVIPPH